jgi:hypothetical protein
MCKPGFDESAAALDVYRLTTAMIINGRLKLENVTLA